MVRPALILTAALLTACTTPTVRDTSAIDARTAQCETPDCVIALMDTLPQGPDSARYPFMEGHPDTRLTALKAAGGLTVEPLNPLALLAGFYGFAFFESHPYGGMKTCNVYHLPGLNWLSLKHELSHCQGYADHGIPIESIGYSDAQKAIMTKEQVSTWTATSVHRSGGDRP